MAKPDDPIRVSELAEFVYCQRAWWLKMVCKETSSMESREAQAEGERWHQQQGVQIARTDALSGAGYPNHLIQVLAYIVLVREHYDENVPYGLVLYGNKAARKVMPTAENLAWFAEVVDQVRRARGLPDIRRSHQQRSRCRGCGLKHSCDQSLDKAD